MISVLAFKLLAVGGHANWPKVPCKFAESALRIDRELSDSVDTSRCDFAGRYHGCDPLCCSHRQTSTRFRD